MESVPRESMRDAREGKGEKLRRGVDLSVGQNGDTWDRDNVRERNPAYGCAGGVVSCSAMAFKTSAAFS